MNRYDIGDLLITKQSFYAPAHNKKRVGIIVEIFPSIKVKWCEGGAAEIILADALMRYKVHKRKHNENRTTENVRHTYEE